MPYEQGTATDYLDLLDKLCAFLTDEGTMGAQAWDVLKNTTDGFSQDGEVYLKGPGLAGADEIFVAIRTSHDVANNRYQWVLQGGVGFDTDLPFDGQPGAIPNTVAWPRVLLANSTMSYTFVANGRRLIVVAIVGTVIESCYCGWIIPYGPPGLWPAPLFIGGCHNSATAGTSDTGNGHSWWLRDFSTNVSASSNAYLRMGDGTWRRMRQYAHATTVAVSNPHVFAVPAALMQLSNNIVPCLDDTYWLRRMEVMLNAGQRETIAGMFDGVAWVAGHALSTADTFSVDAQTWYAFQNVFRTGVDDFAAVALE